MQKSLALRPARNTPKRLLLDPMDQSNQAQFPELRVDGYIFLARRFPRKLRLKPAPLKLMYTNESYGDLTPANRRWVYSDNVVM